MNKAAKCDFPGISDDQAEGSCILSPSHLAKWIPLPAVISVSYNKCLIHNVAQPRNAKLFTGFSAKPCKGDSKPALGALDEFLQLRSVQGWVEEMSSRFWLLHMYDSCVSDCIWSRTSAYENLNADEAL